MKRCYDIIVAGGGHAGCEAALAAARLGARTALVTLSPETVAQMSCNPAIGGLAKGQVVREVDALGGAMGLVADETAIQFRLLNRSKGPAVRGPRCQSDRDAYARAMLARLREQPNLEIVADEVLQVLATDGRVSGIRTAIAGAMQAAAVILTPGTFLNGRLHCGERIWPGGRVDEPPATALSASLHDLGLTLGRLKTGTPPRLHRRTIDFDRLQRQDGDRDIVPFSFLTGRIDLEQVPCFITYTNERVHQLLRDNLHRAPLYSGQIESTGPRYCPSIETKIIRFADHDRHQVFLEPEGRDSDWVYANGISTSVPPDVQLAMVRAIEGLQRAEIIRFGYAIEYDFVPPTQLKPSLQTKSVAGLFLAGQINGTSGYEEAAGQGLMAGLNAARYLARREPVVLGRDQAYVGVMIDDLVTKGAEEPYRLFTSLAEYRLLLRYDNADRRLTPLGREVGLVDERRWRLLEDKLAAMERIHAALAACRDGPRSFADLLRRPEMTLAELAARNADLGQRVASAPLAAEQVEIEIKYAGYLERQARQVAGFRKRELRRIPDDLDYASVPQLRHEAREKFARIRPANLGQAARIPGISQSDVTVLEIHIERLRRSG
ncbi:MAG: tRNA uridine-5-carboxymethylaminomethyl(34) synthesis enzyme MnmG [Planctomycetes bacterium]|nr:tRNA uridine-5-carboxymethylaminomethyl(34) synthesis enzyme MnmG [Planctomycetota bacterium]